ncbi:MAG: thiol-activated cytolysin family protein [Acidobacteriota bacterium]
MSIYFESLGGVITSAPAICSWGAGRLDVFARGTDNALWHKSYDGAWSNWEQLGWNPIGSDPCAVSWGPGRIDVFVRGTDGALYHKSFDGRWSGYEQLGANPIVGAPTVCSQSPGRLNVFVRGTDNVLYHKAFNAAWDKNYAPLGGSLTSDPAAVCWGTGRIDVVARNVQNGLSRLYFDGGWKAWESISGDLSTKPTICSTGAGKLEVFCRNSSGRVIQTSFPNGWGNWREIGAETPSAVAAASRSPERIDIVTKGSQGELAHAWWDAVKGWQPAQTQPDGQTVQAYLNSLPALHAEPSSSSAVNLPDIIEVFEDIPYNVRQQKVRKTQEVSDFVVFNPVTDALYPGALVQGSSLAGNEFAPIYLDRSPGEITITTDFDSPTFKTASRTIDKPSVRTITDARSQLLQQLAPKSSGGAVSYYTGTARTVEHGLISLGVNVKGANWGVDFTGKLDMSYKTNTVIARFVQQYYTVAFRPLGSPPKFFADTVTLDQVKNYATPDNPPCYVSQVIYGRTLFLVVTSNASSLEIEAALKVLFKGKAEGNVTISGEYKKTFDNATVRVIGVGGTGAALTRVLTDPVNELPQYLNADSNFSLASPGAPIGYTFRYLGQLQRTAVVSLSTEYVEATSVWANDVERNNLPIWDGPGGGAKDTGIPIAPGDHIVITAGGTNASGVIGDWGYGPDGWVAWARPRNGAGFPLPENHPFCLTGGYNNRNWFYVGSSYEGDAPEDPGTRNLWLTTNDDNPFNGDPTKQFKVNIRVRRKTSIQLGLNGVRSTA